MSFATIQLITHPRHKPVLKITNGAFEAGVIQLQDDQGCKIDLTPYEPQDNTPVTDPRYLPITRGILMDISAYYGQAMPNAQKVCTISGDPVDGEIYVEIEPNDLMCPGMYLANILLIDEGVVKQMFEMYVESAPSVAWGQYSQHPITIAEIRLWSRDWAPEVNDLLDEVEFKDAEIAAAIRRGVDLWNSTTPMLRQHTYTPVTFPWKYRSQWIDVTIGFLKLMAADWYERNHLTYQAGGISIDDRNKWKGYREDGYMRVKQYEAWLKDVKVQLNMQGGWGRTGYFRLP